MKYLKLNRENKYKSIKRDSQRTAGQQAAAGFTLIELLVVIVVIAILAAISVVAYRGIQTRAATTSYTVAASQAEKAIKLAETAGSLDFESLPYDEDGLFMACIGTEDDFPADGIFGSGECASEDNGNFTISTSSHLVEALQEVSPGFKSSGLQAVTDPYDTSLRGIVLQVSSSALHGDMDAALMWYPPDGKSCGPGTLVGGEICMLMLSGNIINTGGGSDI